MSTPTPRTNAIAVAHIVPPTLAPTPRTDAIDTYIRARNDYTKTDYQVWIKHARTLERELAAAKAECWRLRESSPHALDALSAELTRLRAEVERLKANTHIAAILARVERAEDECLEQARLLGMSGEREADLLGKLERAEKLEKLWKEFITLLEVVEESDSGYEFNPNKISSCRALDGRKLNEILVKARKIVF